MSQWIHDRVDDVIAGLDAVAAVGTIANAILDAFAVFFELVPLELLLVELIGLVSDLAAITASAVDAAMTDAVYADLVCILFEQVQTDGQLTAAGFANVRDLAMSHFTGVAQAVVILWLDSLNYVGLSNAGTLELGTPDCDSCVWCWKSTHDIDAFGILSLVASNTGCVASRTGSVIQGCNGSGNSAYVVADIAFTTRYITSIQVRYNAHKTRLNGTWDEIYLMAYGTNTIISTIQTMQTVGTVTDGALTFHPNQNMAGFRLYQYTRDNSGDGYLQWTQVEVTGSDVGNPFGASNCV